MQGREPENSCLGPVRFLPGKLKKGVDSLANKTPASTNVSGPEIQQPRMEASEFNCLQCPHSRGSQEARKLVLLQSNSNPAWDLCALRPADGGGGLALL